VNLNLSERLKQQSKKRGQRYRENETEKCDTCGKESVVLHRANETAVKGIRWSEECMTVEGKLIDPEVKEISGIIADAGPALEGKNDSAGSAS
jgi:hypothetical protein